MCNSLTVKVCNKSAAGFRHFCDLPTTENDVLRKKRLNFEVEMQYKAGTNCNNSLSGPEMKDGALGGYKVKTALKH